MSRRDRPAAAPAAAAARPRDPFARAWTALWFAERDPALASVLRIGYGVLLLVNVLLWLPDLRLWFTEGGLVPAAVGRGLVTEGAPTILTWFDGAWWLWTCYGALVASAALLTVGWHSRVQAIVVLVLLTSFQHRNYAIVDGEDTLFRLYAFYLALCPAGWAYSLDARRRRRAGRAEPTPVPWALRLFQLQISALYLSSVIEKALGSDWWDGTALYYVARAEAAFGKLPLPAVVFEQLWLVKLMTWGVLALEAALPILLWIPRSRRLALAVGVVFHLAIEYAMNLFLFHWLMILGLLAFAERDELRWPPWRRRAAPTAARSASPG